MSRRRFIIKLDDGSHLATGQLDEKEVLQALGYEIEEEIPVIDADNIKYERLLFLRGVAADMVIFNRYVFQGSFIDPCLTIRIRIANSHFDFVLYEKSSIQAILNALRRGIYRFAKIEKMNISPKTSELYKQFLNMPGTSLNYLLQKGFLPKYESSNGGSKTEENEKKPIIKVQNCINNNIIESKGGDMK